jgi:ribosome maturation factor RimP
LLLLANIPKFTVFDSPLEGDFYLWNMEKHQIFNRIEEIVSSHGFLLIDINFRGDHHLRILEIYIDSEKGITTVDCSNVSRAINEVVENEKLMESSYRLDVSSPGVERPLKYLAQYIKHINRKFEFEYKDHEENKKITAKLIRIESDQLYFEERNAEIKISFQNIIKARVLTSF